MICPLMSRPEKNEHVIHKVIDCKEEQCAWWSVRIKPGQTIQDEATIEMEGVCSIKMIAELKCK